jgi:hypothetical protein
VVILHKNKLIDIFTKQLLCIVLLDFNCKRWICGNMCRVLLESKHFKALGRLPFVGDSSVGVLESVMTDVIVGLIRTLVVDWCTHGVFSLIEIMTDELISAFTTEQSRALE